MSSEKRKNSDLVRAMRDAAQTAEPLELSAPPPAAPAPAAEPVVEAPMPEQTRPVAPEATTARSPEPSPPVEAPIHVRETVAAGERVPVERGAPHFDDDTPTRRMSASETPRRISPAPERPTRRRPFTSLPESAEDWRDRYKVRLRPTEKRAPVVHRPQSVQVCAELADDFGRLLDLLDPDAKPHQRRATSNSAILRLAIGELTARHRRRVPQELLARFRSKAVRGRDTTVRINYSLDADEWSKLQTWLLELNALPPLKPVIGLAHLAEVALEELIPRLIGSKSELELIERLKASAVRGEEE